MPWGGHVLDRWQGGARGRAPLSFAEGRATESRGGDGPGGVAQPDRITAGSGAMSTFQRCSCGCRGARARPAENGWALVRAAPRWRGPPWGFIKDKSPLHRDLGVRDSGDGWISGLALRRRTSRAGRGSYLWQARTTSNAARRRGLFVRSGSCNCPGKTALSCFRIKACAGRGRWRVLSGTGRFAHGRVDVLKAAPTQQEMGDFWRGAPWRYRSSSARD